LFDVLIRNGRVVDGTGNPWTMADVGVKQGRIARVGMLAGESADRIIDGSGLIVSPGFIDIHSHSDFTLLVNPRAESKVRQGVTTEVVGNCGSSAAPVEKRFREYLEKWVTPLLGGAKLNYDWTTMGDYLERLDHEKISLNVASYVGHGTVRIVAMGFDDRDPTRSELKEMERLVEEAMLGGAFGLSSGLVYSPGCYAKTGELISLAKVAVKFGGIYASHIRDEGDALIESVNEAIEIGERASIPVQISHHKATLPRNFGKVKETLKNIEEARGRGVDVTFDQYPYVAGSSGLTYLLPHWSLEGGIEKLLDRLRSPALRMKIRRDMKGKGPGWEDVLLAYCQRSKDLEGKTIAQAAESRRADPYDLVFDLLLADEAAVTIVLFTMSEEDVEAVMRSPFMMVGSDGRAVAPYAPLSSGKPHPRYYGTFVRLLGRYVRERKVLTLESAIRKMTSFTASRLGLFDRGLVKEGMWADLALFDSESVLDRATFAEPHQYASGVEYVIVNGEVVVERGNHTGARSGRVLRGAGYADR